MPRLPNEHTVLDKYLGPVICPKCGKRGYMHRLKIVNDVTGHAYAYRQIQVTHFRSDETLKKTVYDHVCNLGYMKIKDKSTQST